MRLYTGTKITIFICSTYLAISNSMDSTDEKQDTFYAVIESPLQTFSS